MNLHWKGEWKSLVFESKVSFKSEYEEARFNERLSVITVGSVIPDSAVFGVENV